MKQMVEIYLAPAHTLLDLKPTYNVPPSFEMPIVLHDQDERKIDTFRWGLVPAWSKGPDTKYSMHNARSETVAKKPAYRDAFRRRRCVVPASGFYEWKKTPDGKQPYYIYPKKGELFSFAGLYEHWEGDGQKIDSFTIITTPPNKEMKELHDRMPAILLNEELNHWLDPDIQDGRILQDLLRPYPNGQIQVHPVSREVNSPKNQGEHLIEMEETTTN